ncbi:MAG: hypothetical protein Q8M66_00395 [Actinomycetota bacterium]|nr:hypothetical protein [Actinomycetota bacterium]MDZ4179058.1 hypothetical protein [Coriobacteriia bacterium]
MAERIRIGIVGGGRLGAPLIMDFITRPFIEVVAIADKKPDCRGAQIAAQRGIYFTQDPMDLIERSDGIELIIDMTGDPELRPMLVKGLLARSDTTTILVHELSARLIMSLAADSRVMVERPEAEDDGIG